MKNNNAYSVDGNVIHLERNHTVQDESNYWAEAEERLIGSEFESLVVTQVLINRLPREFANNSDCIFVLGNGSETNNEEALETWVEGILKFRELIPDTGNELINEIYFLLITKLTRAFE